MRLISAVVPILVAALVGLVGCDKSSRHDSHATEQGHEHGRGDPKAGAAGLTLDNGKKWRTDASLRTGMANIRAQMQAAMKPIHTKAYSRDEYAALAAGIDKELGAVLASCKLPQDADAQLHLVLTQLFAGTEAMKKGDPMDGALWVVRGLEAYENFFDHPEWQPLEH
jgi:hypothetical protein